MLVCVDTYYVLYICKQRDKERERERERERDLSSKCVDTKPPSAVDSVLTLFSLRFTYPLSLILSTFYV